MSVRIKNITLSEEQVETIEENISELVLLGKDGKMKTEDVMAQLSGFLTNIIKYDAKYLDSFSKKDKIDKLKEVYNIT